MSSIWDILPQRQNRNSLTPCVIPCKSSSIVSSSNAVSGTAPVMQQVKMSSDSNLKKKAPKEKEKKSFLSMPPAAGEESDASSDSDNELHDEPKEVIKHIVKTKPQRAGIMDFLQRRSNSLTVEKASRLK